MGPKGLTYTLVYSKKYIDFIREDCDNHAPQSKDPLNKPQPKPKQQTPEQNPLRNKTGRAVHLNRLGD